MNITKRSLQFAPLALASLVLLTGCDGNVGTVKDQIYPEIDSSMRLGKALETRTDCENGKWDSYSDERGRDVVHYTCNLPQLYLETYKNQAMAQSRYPSPEAAKEATDKLVAKLEERKNDVPHLSNYIQANYATLEALRAVDYTTFSKAIDFLFYEQQSGLSSLFSATGSLPLPSSATSEAECKKRGVSSCDEFYSTVKMLDALFNGLTKALGYSSTHTCFYLPEPNQKPIKENMLCGPYSRDTESDKRSITFQFTNIIEILINPEYPLLSADDIAHNYSTKTLNITEFTDKEITDKQADYSRWLQFYSDITFASVEENFYWYIDDEGNPVSNGGTFTFTRSGKSDTVQMKDSDNYLAVAYQSFPSDRIPNIYLNAMSTYSYIARSGNMSNGL